MKLFLFSWVLINLFTLGDGIFFILLIFYFCVIEAAQRFLDFFFEEWWCLGWLDCFTYFCGQVLKSVWFTYEFVYRIYSITDLPASIVYEQINQMVNITFVTVKEKLVLLPEVVIRDKLMAIQLSCPMFCPLRIIV